MDDPKVKTKPEGVLVKDGFEQMSAVLLKLTAQMREASERIAEEDKRKDKQMSDLEVQISSLQVRGSLELCPR